MAGRFGLLDEVFSSLPDLTNLLIGNLDVEYFTDVSSFVWDGTHFAGYAVVTLDSVIEAHPLKPLHKKQKWALQPTAGVRVNFYTDSKYAFATIHVHGSLYKERDSLTQRKKYQVWAGNPQTARCCVGP
jgi:hypothetical protein